MWVHLSPGASRITSRVVEDFKGRIKYIVGRGEAFSTGRRG